MQQYNDNVRANLVHCLERVKYGETNRRYLAAGTPQFVEDFDNIRYNVPRPIAAWPILLWSIPP